MNLEDLTKEQLISYIKNNNKYGLNWDKSFKQDKNYNIEEVEKYKLGLGKENLIYEGDNYYSLLEMVKNKNSYDVIIVDPPYNKFSNNYSYTDNFETGIKGDKESKWLSFMEDRLKLCHHLLSDEGLVFITLDEIEVYNVKLICDSIFKTSNFIANVIWVKSKTLKNNSKFFSKNHEYILVYAKNKNKCLFKGDERTENTISKWYKNPDKDSRGLWTRGSALSISYRPELDYKLVFKNNKEYSLKENQCWKYPLDKMLALEEDNRISFEPNSPRIKKFLNEMSGNTVPISILDKAEFSSQIAHKEQKSIFNNNNFKYAKPIKLFEYLIDKSAVNNPKILDIFGGSGTTVDAIYNLNLKDSQNRTFTICNDNENNICEKITYQRILYSNNKKPLNCSYFRILP